MFSLEDLNNEFNFIDWKVYFNSIMNDNTFPGKDERFIITSPQYLKEATRIIKNTLLKDDGVQILEDFLKWRILDSIVPILTLPFRQAKSDLVHGLQGIKARLNKSMKGVKFLIPFQVITKSFVEKLPQSYREEIQVCYRTHLRQ